MLRHEELFCTIVLGLLRLKGLDCLVVVVCYYYLLGPTLNNGTTVKKKAHLAENVARYGCVWTD